MKQEVEMEGRGICLGKRLSLSLTTLESFSIWCVGDSSILGRDACSRHSKIGSRNNDETENEKNHTYTAKIVKG